MYEVCLTVSNIYETNTSSKMVMLGATSTFDQEYEVDVSVYPNPTSDYLTINIHNYLAIDGEVRFYNMSGARVKEVQLIHASTVINLQGMESGVYVYKVYVYKVYDGKEELFIGKVVKVE